MVEEKKSNVNVLLGVLIALVVLSGIVSFAAVKAYSAGSVDFSGVNQKFSDLNAKVDALGGKVDGIQFPEVTGGEVTTSSPVESGSYTLNKAEYEVAQTEAKALELATESVNSREFKKAVWNYLKNSSNSVYDLDLESYKDITEVTIKKSDADDNEVEFEVMVKYFTDDDEDNKMKAYLNDFTVSVDGLDDYDEGFDDAEVDEDYLDVLVVNKVREI